MSDKSEISSVANALRLSARHLLDKHELPLLRRIETALAFGHADGLEGWLEIRYALEQSGLIADGPAAPAFRVFGIAIIAYSDHLINNSGLAPAVALNDLIKILSTQAKDDIQTLVNSAAIDPLAEIERHKASLTSGDPVADWHGRWVQQVAHLAKIAQSDSFNASQDLVKVALDEYRFPIDPTGPAKTYANAGAAIQILARRVLLDAGYELIEPVEGQRLNGALHVIEPGSYSAGDTIRAVLRRGLRKGPHLERAVVKLAFPEAPVHFSEPPPPEHMNH